MCPAGRRGAGLCRGPGRAWSTDGGRMNGRLRRWTSSGPVGPKRWALRPRMGPGALGRRQVQMDMPMGVRH